MVKNINNDAWDNSVGVAYQHFTAKECLRLKGGGEIWQNSR